MACEGRALSRHSAMLEVWAVKSCQVVPGGLLDCLGPAGEPWLDIELAYEVQNQIWFRGSYGRRILSNYLENSLWKS